MGNLKVLVVGLNYGPDVIGVPKYTTELCEDLVRRGHEVQVVTAPPYYPAWRIPAPYRGKGFASEVIAGVSVLRCPIYVPARPSGLRRVLHLLSFGASSFFPAIRLALRMRPDLVMAIAPCLASAPGAILAARLAGAKAWLHVQDFEVDAAFDLGLIKGGKRRSLALLAERVLFKAFDRVTTISTRMVDLLRAKGVSNTCLGELRNWVDVENFPVLPSTATTYRHQLAIAEDAIVALYSGNMARKQGLERLAEVAALLHVTAPNIVFLLCGNGPFREELERLCTGLSNVRFLDLQPMEALPELLGTADIHLLPQRAEAADLVLPSKLTGMLASGRPVVAMAAAGTGLATETDGCGLVVDIDSRAMADAVVTLASEPALRRRLGMAARRRAEEAWSSRAILDHFEQDLIALVQSRRQPTTLIPSVAAPAEVSDG